MFSREWPCCWAMRMSELMNAAQVALNCTGDGAASATSAMSDTVDAQIALGALFEKRAGARRAGVVHRIVDGHAVAQVDVLGVLAADLEDRVHLGVEVGRPGGVGRDLVVDVAGAQVGPDQFPGRAGGRRRGRPAGCRPARRAPAGTRASPPRDRLRCACSAKPRPPGWPDRAGSPWSSSIPRPRPGPAGRREAPAAEAAAMTCTRSA